MKNIENIEMLAPKGLKPFDFKLCDKTIFGFFCLVFSFHFYSWSNLSSISAVMHVVITDSCSVLADYLHSGGIIF